MGNLMLAKAQAVGARSGEMASAAAASGVEAVGTAAASGVEAVGIAAAEQAERFVEQAAEIAIAKIKAALKDEDMPKFVKGAVDETVDDMAPEIKDEVMDAFRAQVLAIKDAYNKVPKQDESQLGQPSGCCESPCLVGCLRSWILYPLFP